MDRVHLFYLLKYIFFNKYRTLLDTKVILYKIVNHKIYYDISNIGKHNLILNDFIG